MDARGGTTRVTDLARLQARRNEETVLAEGSLLGERRVAIARIGMLLAFALSMEVASRALGQPVSTAPGRLVAVALYALFAVGHAFVLARMRPDPRLARWAPLATTAVDFGFITYMAVYDYVELGVVRPEMGAIAFAVLLCFSVARYTWWHVAVSTALACGCYTGIGLSLDLFDPLSSPFVLGGFCALGVLIGLTNRSVRHMFRDLRRRDGLTRFLAPQVAERVLAGGQEALLPVQREVTVLFSDIRGFTTFAEQRSPREVLDFLDQYFGTMVQIVKGHDGVVNKFLGDGLLAFWNVPDADAEHARKAVRAALDMRRAVAELSAARERDGQPPLRIGIGIHTGTAAAGMLGGAGQHEYTVIGDAVNVASRVEALTKSLGADVLVTDPARALCGDAFRFERLADETIRGRAETIVLHTVAGN